MVVAYSGILTLKRKVKITVVNQVSNLPQYFYNIGYWGQCYKNTSVNYYGNFNPTF
jgi:hypothetical protein